MKIKTILIIFTLTALVTLLFSGVWSSVKKNQSLERTENEMNEITKEASEVLGEPITIPKILKAQQILDDRKAGLLEKLKDLKETEDFSEKSETAKKLNDCRAANRDKIAVIYNNLVKKSFDDANVLNDLKDKLRSVSSSKTARRLNDEIAEKTKALNANIDVLNEMEKFISNYESVVTVK